ncbi:MAG: hypothetical protein ACXWKR_15545, partial [Phenylobacterium sp.]
MLPGINGTMGGTTMKAIRQPAATAGVRARRLAGALLALGAISLAGAGPAQAQFGSLLKSVVPNLPAAATAARPTPSPSSGSS